MNRRGWKQASVGDVGTYINGLAFKPTDWESTGRPIIRIQNLTNEDRPYNLTTRPVDEKYVVRRGDILVSWSATLDAFRWRGEAAVLNQHIFKVIPDLSKVTDGFLYYQLKLVIDEMWRGEHTHGSTMKHINRGPFLAHPFWIAPLDTQRGLVAVIETQFSRLDAAVASLTRAKAKVASARASVLKAAVEGRLVPTEAELARAEGREYEPASELLKRILADRKQAWEKQGKKGKYKDPAEPDAEYMPDIPHGWCWVSVEQIADEPLCNGRSVPTEEGGFPVLRLTSMKGWQLNFSESKGGAWSRSEAAPWIVKSGDIFIMRGNGSLRRVGSTAIATTVTTEVAFPDTMIRLRPSLRQTAPRYVLIAWSSPDFRAQVEASARTTAGIYKVNQASISKYALPLPPLAEQARIVAEVDRRLSVLDALAASLDANLARCARLRQAIPKRAFEGRLVPPATALAS